MEGKEYIQTSVDVARYFNNISVFKTDKINCNVFIKKIPCMSPVLTRFRREKKYLTLRHNRNLVRRKSLITRSYYLLEVESKD